MRTKLLAVFACLFLISCTPIGELPIGERIRTLFEARGGTERQMRRDARAILELVEGKDVFFLGLDIRLGFYPEFLAKKIALNQKYTGSDLVAFTRILREEMIAMFGERDDNDYLIHIIIFPL